MTAMTPPAVQEAAFRPVLETGPVLEAARAALRPPGPVRWIAEASTDRIELRAAARRWSRADEPPARLARLSCGTALRAARLAVAVQGRQPLVSYPERDGLLAVLHAGGVLTPRPTDLLLHGILRQDGPHASPRVRPPGRLAVLPQLRRAAESEGAWLRVLPDVPSAFAGPCWQGDDLERPGPDDQAIVALVGGSGRLPVADLRVGQAIEALRLTAPALGLDLRVVVAPAVPTTSDAKRFAGPDAHSLAVVEVRRPRSS